MSDVQKKMITWVKAQIRDVDHEVAVAVEKVLQILLAGSNTGELNLDFVPEYLQSALPERENLELLHLARRVAVYIASFRELKKVRRSNFYSNARLPKELLLSEGLQDYVSAAEKGKENALPFLDFLVGLQAPCRRSNLFASIIASSGTGKTQLAATAALEYKHATTIYVNVGDGDEGAQRFYRPHISSGSIAFRKALSTFSGTTIKRASAKLIKDWAETSGDDDGTSVFVHMLHHLLIDVQVDSVYLKLADLKREVQKAPKKFLVFLDEVPPKEDSSFKDVLCLRDALRYLGIAPVLMSTHTGAQDYVGKVSRSSADTWLYALSKLPAYAPFGANHGACVVPSERPLVLLLALAQEVFCLPDAVTKIRNVLQKSKPRAWTLSPALQLVQLFCTDIEIKQNGFTVAHNVVGHHFGCLNQQYMYSECGKKSYTMAEAQNFGKVLSVAPVSATFEPLLFLALTTWDESMLTNESQPWFPLVGEFGEALTVKGAFDKCSSVFVPRASSANSDAFKADGDLLEVLVHASFTLSSLKTGKGKYYLPGVPMKEFLALVQLLLVDERFTEMPPIPAIFDEIDFDWPMVPAMSGSNSFLPLQLAKATNSRLGVLRRPPDKEMVDGTVSYIEPDGSVAEPFISIECKNYSIGVNAGLLKEIFGKIKPGIRCSCIFVSSFEAAIFKNSALVNVKKAFSGHPAFQKDSVSVLVWEKDKPPTFLRVGREEFRAPGETDLLVMIFTVGLVSSLSWDNNRRKRKYSPPCANLPVAKTEN